MIDVEVIWLALNDKPGFVRRCDGAGSVELFYIKRASLSSRRSKSNLVGRYVSEGQGRPMG